jgi:RND family efflux transporter MFP subunit
MRFTDWELPRIVKAAAAMLVVAAAGCGQKQAPSSAPAPQAPAAQIPIVKVAHPEKRDVRRLIERPGYNIEAYERTPLYAKLAGYVQKWNVDMGDTVRKDAVLAELYIPEMEVELTQKQAAVGQAIAEIKRAETAKLRAEAELKRADSQYTRLKRLSGVLEGKDQVEEYRLGFEAAQAALASALAEVDVAKARLEVARTDQNHVQTLLQYTKVRAPFDGVVTGRRTVNVGDFVQPGAATKGEWLFVVEKIKPVRIFVNVQELDAVWVHEHDTALVRIQSLRGQEFKGTVTRVSKSLHPQNRTLLTQIDLPNEDGRLLPGMFANATIVAEHKGVWALPVSAVMAQGEQSFCYRVENGKALRTAIQVGLQGTDWVEVSKKQVKPTTAAGEGQWQDFDGRETVAVSSAGTLTDGQAIGPDK